MNKIMIIFTFVMLLSFPLIIAPTVNAQDLDAFGPPGSGAPPAPVAPPAAAPPAVAQPTLPQDPLVGLKEAAKHAGLVKAGAAPQTLAVFAGRILGGVLALVGLVFLGMMVYGGVNWMIARGNEAEVTKSKDIITSAIIGFVVVALGYVLTNFVFSILQEAAVGV